MKSSGFRVQGSGVKVQNIGGKGRQEAAFD
jgi:hypothetical protein